MQLCLFFFLFLLATSGGSAAAAAAGPPHPPPPPTLKRCGFAAVFCRGGGGSGEDDDDSLPSDSNPTDSTHHDISPELKAEMVKFELSYPECKSQESRPISEVAEEILKNKDFHYRVDYQHNCKVIHTDVSGENSSYRLLISISDDREQILVLVRSFANVPKDRRSAVAEYITRANYGTRIGNFEMDYRDGEVEYRGSLDLKNTELVPDMLIRLIQLTTLTMDFYFRGLMDVIYGGKSPADAIAEAYEADDDDDDESDDDA